MQALVIFAVACWMAIMGTGTSLAQTPQPGVTTAPPPASTPPPSALSPAAPSSNAAIGTLRRQNRRQYLHEQKQRNDAQDVLRNRAYTAPRARTAPR
jgi:hypothetical protein